MISRKKKQSTPKPAMPEGITPCSPETYAYAKEWFQGRGIPDLPKAGDIWELTDPGKRMCLVLYPCTGLDAGQWCAADLQAPDAWQCFQYESLSEAEMKIAEIAREYR